jgi:hypothetical protein
MEDAGTVRRGLFVDGLEGAQFAWPGAVDRLRETPRGGQRGRVIDVIPAVDPALAWGSALPWPALHDSSHPARRVGATAILVDGELAVWVEPKGKRLATGQLPAETLELALSVGLPRVAARAKRRELLVESIDGVAAGESSLARGLLAAGARIDYRGLIVRGSASVIPPPAPEPEPEPEPVVAAEREVAEAPETPVAVDAQVEDGTAASEAAAQPEPDFAAAEAEAAAFTGDLDADDGLRSLGADRDVAAATEQPSIESVSGRRPSADRVTTRVVVHGLVSVASIATFKRSLGRVSGVSAIGVASGPDGEFVFTVSHDTGLALGTAIGALPGFEANITAETAGGLEVAAHDPDAGD